MGGYGGRTRLQQLWLAGSVGLAVLLVAGGGVLAIRGAAAPTPTPVRGVTATGAATPPAPVAFGAPEIVEGVPWGWPQTSDGAAAAALTVVAVTGQPDVVFDPGRFAQVADVVFAPAIVGEQARQVQVARTQLEQSAWADQPTSRRMYHLAPLAVTVRSFHPEAGRARVDVWAMTLIGVGDAGGATFTTSTVDLHTAAAGGWTVVGLDTVEGPTPMVHARASAPGATRALLAEAASTLPVPLGARP